MPRRVASQRAVMDATLRHLAEKGEESMLVTDGARTRRAEDGAAQGPVWFDGQDEAPPSQDLASMRPRTVDDPGAREYRIPVAALSQPEGTQREDVGDGDGTLTGVLGLHEVDWSVEGEEAVFAMAQGSKNVIPLLLDARAERATVDGAPIY